MSLPPLDLDLAELELRKLRRLAKAMGLDEALKSWLDRRGRLPSKNEQIGQDATAY
jgi:hypothetical protein